MNKVIIIAEAGVNHNGSLRKAKALIDVASKAGADFVKFQSFKANKLVSPDAQKAEYQKKNIGDNDDNQFQMLRNLELSEEGHEELLDYCNQKNIAFFSTAFDVDGLSYLDSLGLNLFKVPSGEITNYPYLRKLAEIGKPVILSTGMSNLLDIERALEVLEQGIDRSMITILHCNTEYPTPMEDVNLKAMNTIESHFKTSVGYSDHTMGIEGPVVAVALGATVIEKHFILDKNIGGPDAHFSLDEKEFTKMVKAVRIAESMMGKVNYEMTEKKKKSRQFSRSLFVVEDIKAGEVITEKNTRSIRPGFGMPPKYLKEILGRKANRDLEKGTPLQMSDI